MPRQGSLELVYGRGYANCTPMQYTHIPAGSAHTTPWHIWSDLPKPESSKYVRRCFFHSCQSDITPQKIRVPYRQYVRGLNLQPSPPSPIQWINKLLISFAENASLFVLETFTVFILFLRQRREVLEPLERGRVARRGGVVATGHSFWFL